MLDDIGSAKIDLEEHPERTYLHKDGDRLLFKAFGIVAAAHAIIWYLVGVEGLYLIDAFIMVSVIMYLLFSRNRTMIYILPFLKYPLLMFWVSGFSFGNEQVLIQVGVLLMMLTYDAIEAKKTIISFVLLLLTGYCFLNFLPIFSLVILVALPGLAIWLYQGIKHMKYLPILYFPLVVFLIKSLS
jgi:hypothetical protein